MCKSKQAALMKEEQHFTIFQNSPKRNGQHLSYAHTCQVYHGFQSAGKVFNQKPHQSILCWKAIIKCLSHHVRALTDLRHGYLLKITLSNQG
ncbi:hypothetical protein SDC9_188689 [bioreactor metagenome]|uniref:Uncharacterized protein n=1 Tax=bioreactor metagenome TaxID=1076179 RepID=A0A645HQ90_9ZZZZ